MVLPVLVVVAGIVLLIALIPIIGFFSEFFIIIKLVSLLLIGDMLLRIFSDKTDDIRIAYVLVFFSLFMLYQVFVSVLVIGILFLIVYGYTKIKGLI